MSLFPIDSVLPDIRAAFEKHRNVVLSADPGAGKTTRVPPALLGEYWLTGKKIVMLEPRRLAAKRSALFMAQQLGEKLAETIGYRIRGEGKIGNSTRIEVVTEGVLTRLLQSDPSLPDVGLVIFDEFHERSINADLGLALTLNVQEHLRADLRILIMSATLDSIAIESILGDAFLIKSEGRIYPVATHYLEHSHQSPVEPLVVSTILKALKEETGDLLVFLPGQREIRKIESLLTQKSLPENVYIHTLYGDASPDRQQAALAPAAKASRKIILSTSIAETSLTIDGVRVVIDSGLMRSVRFDPRRGMSGLVTIPVAQANADQRRGRSARQQPGVCYRLWTEPEHHQLQKFSQPEILNADLTPLALELARWGTPHGEGLNFLDPPPTPHLSQARDLLHRLGALNKEGKLTQHGQAIAELPVHPRFAHMLLQGKSLGAGSLACDVAALLEERDLLRGEHDKDIDLHSRWYALRKGRVRDKSGAERVTAQAARLRQLIGVRDEQSGEDRLGLLLALAYPERVAKRREVGGMRYQFSGGTGATLPKGSMLTKEQYLAVADVDGVGNEVKIYLAEPLTEKDIREAFSDQFATVDEAHWDERKEMVVARQVTRFGAIELSETKFSPPEEVVRSAMIDGIRLMGLEVLPWSDQAISIRTRSEWLRAQGLVQNDWPDLGEPYLIETLDKWLSPFLEGKTKKAHLKQLDMSSIVQGFFSYQQLRELDRLAPTHLTVPTGSRIAIEYKAGEQPILAVRLQEMFGQTVTPTVGGGKVNVLLHLLSPARRPLAVTQDLPSFWNNAYHQVRKDMRGRYPRHYWPENPLEAEPTRRTKRR